MPDDALELYQRARGLAQDSPGALDMYEQAARLGYTPAKYQAGMILRGNGPTHATTPSMAAQADTWLEEASADGHPFATDRLAEIYQNGVPDKPIPNEAHAQHLRDVAATQRRQIPGSQNVTTVTNHFETEWRNAHPVVTPNTTLQNTSNTTNTTYRPAFADEYERLNSLQEKYGLVDRVANDPAFGMRDRSEAAQRRDILIRDNPNHPFIRSLGLNGGGGNGGNPMNTEPVKLSFWYRNPITRPVALYFSRRRKDAHDHLHDEELSAARRQAIRDGRQIPQTPEQTTRATAETRNSPTRRSVLGQTLKYGLPTLLGGGVLYDGIDRLSNGQGWSMLGSIPRDGLNVITGVTDGWSTLGDRLSDPRVSMLTEAQFREKLKKDLLANGEASFTEKTEFGNVSLQIKYNKEKGVYTLQTKDDPPFVFGSGNLANAVGTASYFHYAENPQNKQNEYANYFAAVVNTPLPATDDERKNYYGWIRDTKAAIKDSIEGRHPVPPPQNVQKTSSSYIEGSLANPDQSPKYASTDSPTGGRGALRGLQPSDAAVAMRTDRNRSITGPSNALT